MKKAIIPILAVAAGLMFAPRPADAGVRVGVYVGPPAVVVPAPAHAYAGPYYNPYYDPYYAAPPVYGHPYGYGYVAPAPRYYPAPHYPAPLYRNYVRHDYRGGHNQFNGRARGHR